MVFNPNPPEINGFAVISYSKFEIAFPNSDKTFPNEVVTLLVACAVAFATVFNALFILLNWFKNPWFKYPLAFNISLVEIPILSEIFLVIVSNAAWLLSLISLKACVKSVANFLYAFEETSASSKAASPAALAFWAI